MSLAPPKQCIQTVQDFAITSQLWQDHLVVKITPLLSDFFLSIYHSCLNYAKVVLAKSGNMVNPINHFAHAVEPQSEQTHQFTGSYHQAAARTHHSFQDLLRGAGVGAHLSAAPEGCQIHVTSTHGNTADQAQDHQQAHQQSQDSVPQQSHAHCQTTSHHLQEAAQDSASGLLQLIQGSNFMDTILKAMKTKNRFTPSAILPPPHQMAADSIAATESIQETK
jgi:hypothetical protein